MIVLACVLVLVVVFVFLVPVFSANKLADAFDREGISYQMINSKNLNCIYKTWIDENGRKQVSVMAPYEAAEEELSAGFDLEGVEFQIINCGMFYITDGQEGEKIVGQFYHFRKGSEQVYSAVAEEMQRASAANGVAIRKGKYVFYLYNSEIPSSMENVLSRLSGAREQTLSE